MERLAEVAFSGGVVLVSLHGSTRVEETFVPIPTSSPDAVGRGTLLVKLQKMKKSNEKTTR